MGLKDSSHFTRNNRTFLLHTFILVFLKFLRNYLANYGLINEFGGKIDL